MVDRAELLAELLAEVPKQPRLLPWEFDTETISNIIFALFID